MGSDDIDTVNISDDDDNMFNESDSMELFDQRQQPNAAVQTDDYACIDTVLQPVKDDLIMQERHLDISGESKDAMPSIVTKSKSPKSTIAVRAMENETRRSHPELASLWENGRVCDSGKCQRYIDVEFVFFRWWKCCEIWEVTCISGATNPYNEG